MWTTIGVALIGILPQFLLSVFGIKKPAVSTDQKLGADENELQHVKQDQSDRKTLNDVPDVSGAAGLDRVRNHDA